MKGTTQDEELKKAGLDLNDIVDWSWSRATWRSGPADRPRLRRQQVPEGPRLRHLEGYVKAENSDRGEWAFRDGQSPCRWARSPKICKYEKLRENPGPFYEDSKWYAA